MKQLSQLLTLLLLFIHLNGRSQTRIQHDKRVDPVLKQVDARMPGLKMFRRNDGKNGYVNMAVLEESTRKLKWLTCHGRAFDSAELKDNEYGELLAGALDPFTFYRTWAYEKLSYIEGAKMLYRLNGKAALQDTSYNISVVFNTAPVRSAQSTLQKLVAMEGLSRTVYLQLRLFDCKAPRQLYLTREENIHVRQDMAGTMIRKVDSTEYFNKDPLSAAARIVLYNRLPGKLFVYNQEGALMDSVPLKPGKYAALLKEREDVFLLYRGWKELQWQQVVDEKRQYAAYLRRLDSSLYRSVSSEQSDWQLQNIAVSLQERQNEIDNKISSLIVPEEKYVGQLLADLYKNETSEILYLPGLGFAYSTSNTRGHKTYELTDHRGNVLAAVSDKKKGIDDNADGIVGYYNADIVHSSDYYPFGALMPGRTFSSGDKYRYGYNGKENDNEVKGEGNQQDYGMRIYDPRVARFLSVDPITAKYPELTPYQFASNRPIDGVDLDGLEHLPTGTSMYRMGVAGTPNKIAILSTERFVVQTVKENTPHALLDENGRLAMRKGGPIGTDGQDIPGPSLYPEGTYYNMGPEFQGMNGDDPGDDIAEFRRNDFSELGVKPPKWKERTATGLEAIESISDLSGLIENQLNTSTWYGLAKEAEHRDAFYKSTKIVNEYFKNNAVKDKALQNLKGKADLINFLTDGTLPEQSSVEYQLSVFYSGYQMILQKGVDYQKGKLTETFDRLNSEYIQSRGKKNFSNIRDFRRTEP